MYTFFLGTNSDLSSAEITAVLTRHGISFTIASSQKRYIRIQTESAIPIGLVKILGGTIRVSQDVASWNTMPSAEEILTALQPLPPKWQVGLGHVGMSLNIRKLGIELKKTARSSESKFAFIEPKAGTVLNAAQVIFNKLTSLPNAELIFIQENENIMLVRTTSIQDIASYELRDTMRPARDARIGLLPPKLAQIMINLALPQGTKHATTIYDPFCGMGTVLQEAWLMNIPSIGTDISSDMVSASTKNIEYVGKNFSVATSLTPQVFHHDATNPNFPEELRNKAITVVTEPFLGTPLTRALSPASSAGRPSEATQFYESVIPLYRQFFMNIKSVLQENARLLVLLPAPRVRENRKDTFTPLPRTFLDEIITFGYRKIKLIPEEKPLLYARPNALIARELTLWERV